MSSFWSPEATMDEAACPTHLSWELLTSDHFDFEKRSPLSTETGGVSKMLRVAADVVQYLRIYNGHWGAELLWELEKPSTALCQYVRACKLNLQNISVSTPYTHLRQLPSFLNNRAWILYKKERFSKFVLYVPLSNLLQEKMDHKEISFF